MILWINGAFGSGKTTSAYELHRRLPQSFVYDPENIGYFLFKNMPTRLRLNDFQDYPQWRLFNYEMLKELAAGHEGVILAPMTVTNPQYFDEIIGRLRREGIEVKHYILYAERATLEKRLNKRLQRGETWAKAQIDRCLHAFNHDIPDEKIITDHLSIDAVVQEIAARSGLTLTPDNRSALKKWTDRIRTLIRHIRR
ncbi:AAA family ATPase [Paenibacillus sp. YN15]|uniref:AAA family ATPase n=1 Tax=Paenibacillus sp. YN15 TaxID=1742774 RepID=UPI000DCD0164|nr:AAA family ATPase [Paenibacillus sp. YN15]RAV03451.1 tunicamycin resistance protein [Paenibacillus sp. YN15]